MAKIDLNAMSIEELVALRDSVTAKLAEKVAARKTELEAELNKLSQYGKPSKKSPPSAVKVRTSDDTRRNDKRDPKNGDEGGQPVAEAA